MSNTYVAIDVETTGLDPRSDAIVEVAAIVFRGNDVLDQYTSLVNPHREVPAFITELTGITQSMVEDAPSMFAVRSRLKRILSDHVLVGHNVGFDLSFMREERLGIGNHRVDTLTLASILFPQAGRFGLAALARYLDLPEAQNHRAFNDAEQTLELFLALKEKALSLDIVQLEEITRVGDSLGWPETILFQELLAQKAKHAFDDGDQKQKGRLPRLFRPPKLTGRSVVATDEIEPLDVELISNMLRSGGNFSQVFDSYEYRPQQVDMLESVAEAFNRGDHVLIEAGTGTGKSMAYLLPAAFWARNNGRRVVISTNTINLQDQLIHKDIPELGTMLPFEIRAAVRKGRGNYLCTRLFRQMRHSGPSNADEMALLARIMIWLPTSETGDVAEITLRTPGERLAWSRWNGENATCTYDQCAAENCPLHLARRRAEQAHIVIVNHALLLSDMASQGHVLPDSVDLIIDEAHHLESAVTSGLSFRADKRFLKAILDEVTSSRAGLVADVQRRARAALPPELFDRVDELIDRLRREAQSAGTRLDEFFDALRYFLAEHASGRSQFAQQIRLIQAVRTQPDYDEIEMGWDGLNKHLQMMVRGFNSLARVVAELVDSYDIDDDDELILSLTSNGRSLEETRANIDAIVSAPLDDMIYWAEVWKERVSLHAAPLHVGPLVEEHVFGAKETVILTSATMRTARSVGIEAASFDYIRDRLYATDASELAVGSPFNYEDSTLLYLVTDMPEPNQPGYQRYVEEAIVEVAKALGGKTLVLFTAYGQLNQVARAIEQRLNRADIALLAQSTGSSRQQLLNDFRQEGSRSVLLGTRSFWEGVDVPGSALQAVMIAKLPFDVPSDPVFAARSETFDNAFFEYSVPEAVLRFRQGFGRLIRRQTDDGVVVILDKRVLTKRYGRMFLEALPECTVIRQRADRLGELTKRWLSRENRIH
jgi:DNA polymerase-3 subunit epsilon/ATP-dependent DNA helicase DinG